jgi:hypothetical protein
MLNVPEISQSHLAVQKYKPVSTRNINSEEVMGNAVLAIPTDENILTYDKILVSGMRLAAKCDPAQSEANRLSYRAAWLGILAEYGWTEGEWFRAASGIAA